MANGGSSGGTLSSDCGGWYFTNFILGHLDSVHLTQQDFFLKKITFKMDIIWPRTGSMVRSDPGFLLQLF